MLLGFLHITIGKIKEMEKEENQRLKHVTNI